MIYIQILNDENGAAFVALAKSGTSVLCLPDDTYAVTSEHLKLLRQKRIPFKKLEKVRMPEPSRPHNDKI
jgi:hypothetical protein